MLARVGSVEKAMNCGQIDLAIDQADTVRWVMRVDGVGTLQLTPKSSGLGIRNLDAAETRIRGLLQLKRDRSCPARPTAFSGTDDAALSRKLDSIQAQIDAAGWFTNTYPLLQEGRSLLDGLRPMPTVPRRPPTAEERYVPSHQGPVVVMSLPARMPQSGDMWTYRYIDRWTNSTKGPFVHEIVGVSETVIRERRHLEDAQGNGTEHSFGATPEFVRGLCGMPEFAPYLQVFEVLDVTRRWDIVLADPADPGKWVFSGQITGFETLTVPAGTFTAMRVELNGKKSISLSPGSDAARAKFVLWYAPEVKRVLKYTRQTYKWNGDPLDQEACELLDYKVTNAVKPAPDT
jgi:hypothetical protein